MLNLDFDAKFLKAFLLAFLLFTSLLYSQSNTFKLGFTGTYPNRYTTYTYQTEWSWYNELSMNTWAGWWVGDTAVTVLDNLNSYGLNGYFQPDSLRWAGYGRVMVTQAEETGDRFKYNSHWCGSNYQDVTQFGSNQWVRYFNKNSACNDEDTPAGLVFSGVNENGFQSIANFGMDPKYQAHFPGDGTSYPGYLNRYYVKPRMRIDSTEADSDPPKNVVKIMIKAFNGDPAGEFIITTNDFRNNGPLYYNGKYIEDYLTNNASVAGDDINTGRPDMNPYYLSSCQVDYQIYWYGEVSVYIDYVKVMDEAANRLFNNEPLVGGVFKSRLSDKIHRLQFNDAGNKLKGFYMEEVDYSNIACLQYLNDSLLPLWSGNDPDYKMIGLINWISFRAPLKNGYATDYADYINAVHPPALMFVAYPFEGPWGPHPPKLPDNLTYQFQSYYPSIIEDQITDRDNGYPSYEDTKANYNTYLQNDCWNFYIPRYDTIKALCQSTGTDFHLVPQVHTWKDGSVPHQSHREPMNSELGAMFTTGICHGIKGIMPFVYESWYEYNNPSPRGGNGVIEEYISSSTPDGYSYAFGMTDFSNGTPWWGYQKRVKNFYGEDKWNYVKDLYGKIKTWGAVLANSVTTEGFSVHSQGADHEFIHDIISINPHLTGQNPCLNDYQVSGLPSGPYCDCPEERYWELGFFSTTQPNTKYFMAVNRRCIPAGGGYAGDNRVLRIKFDAVDFPNFNSWKISEVGNSIIAPVSFSRNYNGYVDIGSTISDMGWFKPGEGKLFKIEAIPVKGGTLVDNEDLSGVSFTCEDTVFNGGYNITIDSGSTVSFIDSSCIVMSGGTFQSGVLGSGSGQLTTFKGSGSSKWSGLSLNNTVVKIYNTKFQDISSLSVNHAVKMVDCPMADIRNNVFVLSTDTAGAVYAGYTGTSLSFFSGLYINYNNITMANSHTNAVQVQGFGGLTMPVYVKNNTMTSNGYATGIMFSTITGGVVGSNSITGFATGLSTILSTVDMQGNTITNNSSVSEGILATDGSFINMTGISGLMTGGMNVFSGNYNGASVNVHIVSSLFDITNGANTFVIKSSTNSGSYHFYGTFPDAITFSGKDEYNCYKLDNVSITDPDQPIYDIEMSSTPQTIAFMSYLCEAPEITGNTVIDIGNGLYDTIPNIGGGIGLGGGHSSAKKKMVELSPKALHDSITVQIRHRNYNAAKNTCYELIESYPDSVQSLVSLSTLFLSVISSDTSSSAVSELKSFYENLILEHSGNTGMVTSCNYLIQKCKVKLMQYSSALSGFQSIIDNNPYSYLGLLARWDYMATSLLLQGQGGGMSSSDLEEDESIDIVNALPKEDGDDDNPKSGKDKNPLTKEQKQIIRETVKFNNETGRDKSEIKIKQLEEKSDLGDVISIKELTTLKVLKDVIKSEKPKNMFEHIRIVNSDIQKVFYKDIKISEKKTNSIPTVFRISQNYPNPFNPTTKINYDLPKDSKVNIIIYDILGREVKKLVNNEIKQAGTYIVDFNASNNASGVYFYRIEAEEPNGNKFVDSKKMVLLK